MISITDEAKKHFDKVISEKKAIGIKLNIINTGCSGKSYSLGFIEDSYNKKEYISFTKSNIVFQIEKRNVSYFRNMKIDLKKIDFNEKIVFINPNISEKCGCGESFKSINKTNENQIKT